MYACMYSTLQYSMYVFTNEIITKILRDILGQGARLELLTAVAFMSAFFANLVITFMAGG